MGDSKDLPGEITNFKPEYLADFQDLFRLIWKKEYPLEVYRWRFENNPFGSPIIRLCWEKARLIGFYGVIPRQLYVPKIGILNGLLSLDTITHPDFRGKEIFPALAREVYAEGFRKNHSLVFGFPNQNSKYSIEKKLNWILQPVRFSFEYDLKNLHPSSETHLDDTFAYSQISEFDEKIDGFWIKHKEDNLLAHTPRTKEYLNWRLMESPIIKYRCYYVFNSAQLLVGYFALKEFRPGIYHIVDFYCENSTVFEFMFSSAMQICRNEDAQTLSLWNTQPEYLPVLNRYPHRTMDIQTSFGFLLNPLAKLDKAINEKSWSITMADSDVF